MISMDIDQAKGQHARAAGPYSVNLLSESTQRAALPTGYSYLSKRARTKTNNQSARDVCESRNFLYGRLTRKLVG